MSRDRCRAGGAPRGLLSVDQSCLLREASPRQHVVWFSWLLIGLGPIPNFFTYSRINSWTLFSWSLLHHGDFLHHDYIRTVFVLSTLYFMCCTHIQVKSLVQYFCGRLRKISQQILVKHINCHVQRENPVTFLDFRILQGNVATYCRWGGNLCRKCIKSFLVSPLVKEFLKSVHNCQSYYQTSSGFLFWDIVYNAGRGGFACSRASHCKCSCLFLV